MLLARGENDVSAQEIQSELSEIERDLTLRRLLWESQEEWDKLADDWTAHPFESLNVEQVQKTVNRFSQTVFMLEKGDSSYLIECVNLEQKQMLFIRWRE